ncbi:hypothetical protein JCGZ_07847 [Jatropha curcas]|uniref:Uncharacterized protein n=1 Tax=Jatropha curcas TaxID=180498 RepID=A0A067KNC7_JATCU|nr:hypothetical protein JCGZ_07847 [Jatropha curcas]
MAHPLTCAPGSQSPILADRYNPHTADRGFTRAGSELRVLEVQANGWIQLAVAERGGGGAMRLTAPSLVVGGVLERRQGDGATDPLRRDNRVLAWTKTERSGTGGGTAAASCGEKYRWRAMAPLDWWWRALLQLSLAKNAKTQKRRKRCEYPNFEAQRASFSGLQTVRPDRKPFGKFTGNMPIWYLKCPENYGDHRTGPGIFFGGPELPKKLPEC